MPPLTPAALKQRLSRARAAASAPRNSTRARTGFFSSRLPRDWLAVIEHVRRNPGSTVARFLPGGVGAASGIIKEARLERDKENLMIARAKDASARTRNPAPTQQFSSPIVRPQAVASSYPPAQAVASSYPPAQAVASSYPPAVDRRVYPPQRSLAPARQSFVAPRRQPPVSSSSRPVARTTSDRFRSAIPTTLAAWVLDRSRQRARKTPLRRGEARSRRV